MWAALDVDGLGHERTADILAWAGVCRLTANNRLS